tara:strand:- start:5892 stop:6080 length:189 start_codon:yes stop_codon:yes gene_type:complete
MTDLARIEVAVMMLEERIKSLESSLRKIRDVASVYNDVEETWHIEQIAKEALQEKNERDPQP